MSRRRKTFPTNSEWLLEEGHRIDRTREEDHTYGDVVRNVLETLHSLQCDEDLCHPSCDFSLLIAHYYERLSIKELTERYHFRHKGSISYRLDKAKARMKEAFLVQLGYDPYE